MKNLLLSISVALLFFTACKKETGPGVKQSKQLFPLAAGNKWIYIDSFFNNNGIFYKADSFQLKVAKSISRNNRVYTPITDIFDDSIFTIASTDTTVFILKEIGEAIMFRFPINEMLPVIITSYHNDSLNSSIFTRQITSTSYPSYKILITQNDGLWWNYKQQELFFTPGIGIIKGRDIKKNITGSFYTYDSYRLVAYSLY